MSLSALPAFDEQVLLLDDEVVALAARADAPWPSNTPTLDPTGEHGLREAAQRGIASLVMRSLVDLTSGDALVEPLRTLCEVVLKGRPVFGTFTGMTDGRMVPFFSNTAVYESAGSWVMELITPSGAHYLIPTDLSQCMAQAGDVMERAAAADPGDTANDTFLCFVSAPPQVGATEQFVRIARVKPGVLETGILAEGTVFTPTEAAPTDARAALAFVIG